MVKKKLLHITTSLKIGGAETVLCDLVDGLGGDTFEHHVIYFYDGPQRTKLQSLGVRTYHVKGCFSLYDPCFFCRLYRCVKNIQPDFIHSLLWSANVSSRIVSRLLHIPNVSAYHNNICQDGRVRNWFDYHTRRFSKKCIAVSHEVATSLVAQDAGAADKLVVILNGIDVQSIQKQAERQQVKRSDIGLLPEHFVVGSVGRFCPVKRYPLLLRAFKRVLISEDAARLVLVGIGPEEQRLRQVADALGIQDKVFFIVGKSAYGYYPLFDCFVQSSDKEGISMALLEAISCAVPVIVTNSKPTHDVIDHERTGIIVPAGNENMLAQRLVQVIYAPHIFRLYAEAGRKKIECSFSKERMIASYRAVFESLFEK